MVINDVLSLKKEHLIRLSTTNGLSGERESLELTDDWIPRPKNKQMKNLLTALESRGIKIKPTAFDAIAVPNGISVNFDDINLLASVLPKVTFIEIKTSNQGRVKPDFSGFFFAITENEIEAAKQLGENYKVALFNKRSKEMTITSVPDLINRARSMTWQVSIQL